MYELLKDQYEMYGADVKPIKASAMYWIDYQLHAIEKLVDKHFIHFPFTKCNG